MKKAGTPFVHPFAVRFVSPAGGICLALVLAVHLLFIVWIGWPRFDEKPEMAVSVMGRLVPGEGKADGYAGDRPGNRAGPERKSPEKAALASGKISPEMKRHFSGKGKAEKGRRDEAKSALAITTGGSAAAENPAGMAQVKKRNAEQAGKEEPGKDGEPGSATHSAIKGEANGTEGNEAGGNGNRGEGVPEGYGRERKGAGSGGIGGAYGGAGLYGNPKPPYPAVSRRMGEEGVVMLAITVLADGRVGEVKVKRSSGFARLDESALKTVRYWRYAPSPKDGRPFAFRYVQPIRFSLDD